MAVLPSSRAEMIAWFNERAPTWATDPTGIGLTAANVAELVGKINLAENSLSDAATTRTSALDATVVFHNDSDDLRGFGADLIKLIKAYAESTNDPNVYAAASVPPPAPPTPAGPPDMPTNLTAELLNPFGLGLSWKGSVSQGTFFGIWRRLDAETEFTLVKTTKNKTFADTTFPAGTNTVDYYIAAIRDDFQVNSTTLSLQFGANGASGLTLAA
jgi:hypothetical protein